MRDLYTPEQRTRQPFWNREWHALSGKEHRMPGQFSDPVVEPQVTPGEVLLTDMEVDQVYPVLTGKPPGEVAW